MTYLAFMLATGLYLGLGPGGPLHNDQWFQALRRRVDAIEPDFWIGFVLLVVVPCAVVTLIYALMDEIFGDAAMLLIGTAALFFGFGRADLTSLLERFQARCQVGDLEGGALVLEEAGAELEADDAASFGRGAARTFLYEGFQRWFPPVFYFLLLGPAWAVAYRLVQLSADDRRVPVGSLRHLIDWLPSRLLLLTFVVAGHFDQGGKVFKEKALDASIETDELLLQGVEASFTGEAVEPADQVFRVQEMLKRALVIWLVAASLVAIVA